MPRRRASCTTTWTSSCAASAISSRPTSPRSSSTAPADYQRILDFVESFAPRLKSRVELHAGPEALFDLYGIEPAISRALERRVWLKSGGYIVIDQTEALTTIDVNTGRYVGKHNQEETVLKTNLEAAREIVDQLRIRNIGGIIIVDFIDMVSPESRQRVMDAFDTALRQDKMRSNILKISELGLVEMTRKRTRASLSQLLTDPCPSCEGKGRLKSVATIGYEIMRRVRHVAAGAPESRGIVVRAHARRRRLPLRGRERRHGPARTRDRAPDHRRDLRGPGPRPLRGAGGVTRLRAAGFVDLAVGLSYTSRPLRDDTVMPRDHAPARLEGVLAGVLRGAPLELDDAYALVHGDDDALPGLLAAAGVTRDRGKGRSVTYSRKVFLPITNLCRDRCAYCTFRKDPGDPGAWTMTPDEIAAWITAARRQGCKEALMCLGDSPEAAFPEYRATLRRLGHASTIGYVREACEIALELGILPHTNAGLLTVDEMRLLRPVNASLGLMLENVSPRLRAAGMPHQYAPDKEPARRVAMMAEAGRLRIPFTTGILLGIGETPEERVDSLFAIADLHAAYGHIQEVIIQNFRGKLGMPMADASEPTASDLARTIAIARLLLGPDMNIQAPPNLSPDAHRLLLRAGINDWGGISPVSRDYVNPEAAWPMIPALQRTCADEGFALRERLAIYPEYVGPRFLDPALAGLVDRLAEGIRTEDAHAHAAH